MIKTIRDAFRGCVHFFVILPLNAVCFRELWNMERGLISHTCCWMLVKASYACCVPSFANQDLLLVHVRRTRIRGVTRVERRHERTHHNQGPRTCRAVEKKLHTLEDHGHKSMASRTGEVGLARSSI